MRVQSATSISRQFASVGLAALFGLCACVAAVQFGEPTTKKLIFAAAVPLVPLICWITRQPRSVLMFLWILLLPYNRMYYWFDGLVGDHGPHGPYVIPTDVILAALFGLWAYELGVLKRPLRPAGPRLELWLLPFGLMCLLSSLGAPHMSWGLFELLRLVKVAAIIIYIRFNVTRREVCVCVVALLCSLCAQSGVAMLQMALRSTAGVLGLLGGGGETDGLREIGEAAVGGWHRAVGTVGHPSNLACYMLIPIPLAAALALTAPNAKVRLLSGIAMLLGLGGLGCTLSRWPAALSIAQFALLAILLTRLGLMRTKQTLGLLCVSVFVGAVALLPFYDLIYERITKDLGASMEFREKEAEVALTMFESAPLLGVGLSNYAVYLIELNPEMQWTLDNADKVRHTLKIRTFVALHHFYLFMLAETGILGLAALLVFYLGIIYCGTRSILATSGVWRATGVGMLVGLLGVLGQGFVDFSFWVDPILYTFVIVAAILAKLAVLENANTPGVGPPTPDTGVDSL